MKKSFVKVLRVSVYLMPFHAVATKLTWRDIKRRPGADIRGSKRLWRSASCLHPVGAGAYWLVGRKRVTKTNR